MTEIDPETSGAAHDPREGRQFMDCRDCATYGKHTWMPGCVFYEQEQLVADTDTDTDTDTDNIRTAIQDLTDAVRVRELELQRDIQRERALADDLAEVLASVVVEYEPNEASRVLARHREART